MSFFFLIAPLLLSGAYARLMFNAFNDTLAGLDQSLAQCHQATPYDVSATSTFSMCIGKTAQDVKNGRAINQIITSRGYLPTCRSMHLLMWMSATANGGHFPFDLVVDVGSNIGSCALHMAALGFPVVAVEPVVEHIHMIRASLHMNHAFKVDLHHAGIAAEAKVIHANFLHGGQNWGATQLQEGAGNDRFEYELPLYTVDQLIRNRRVSLLKVDCEGCEWSAMKGATRSLPHVQIIKIEFTQKTWVSGNETVSPQEFLQFLEAKGFALYRDHFEETDLYFGRKNKEIISADRIFGSKKFKLGPDVKVLREAARTILANPIVISTFDQTLYGLFDIIAIKKDLSDLMVEMFV